MKKIISICLLSLLITSFLNSQSYNTTFIGSAYIPTRAFDVKVDGRFAYVVGWQDGGYGSFSIFDIQFPPVPNLISTMYISDAYGIDVRGNYAYVAEGNTGLSIYNISIPSNPFLVGQKYLPGSAKDVKVVGNFAYVADEYAGLRIINISNPQNPVEVGFYDTRGRSFDVEIKNNIAYLADMNSGFLCIDISNPENPTVVSEYPASNSVIDIHLQDTLAYFTDGYAGIKVLNISDANNLQLIDSLNLPYWCLGIKISGDYAYIAAWGNGGLRIVDISNPANMYEVGFYNTPGNSRDVDVVGSLAFIADWDEGGLQIINNDLLNPLPVDSDIDNSIPKQFNLLDNFPNPFNPQTTIKFEIANAGFVSLRIYDTLGKVIRTLISEEKVPGFYEINFDGSNLSSGVYYYVLREGNISKVKKMLLLK
jgi:hypothetical protein